MLLAYESDTITAISTPPGEGGISVIRVSGDNALGVVGAGFRGAIGLDKMSSHTAQYGRFVNEHGQAIDNVVVLVFKKPSSYTGENTVEISCHGGRFLTRRILEATMRFGARAAQPGEFTKRAFLNGRLDLAQAEAVADLIHARSERAHHASLAQLGGQLSQRVHAIRSRLIESLGLIELELDFAEDGYEFADKEKVVGTLKDLISNVRELMATYVVGRVYRDGVKVALAGAPNVGKSSLLNALLQEERAIVTDIPGTTRDVIEESINLDGILFDLSDTAGLRESVDPIEREGVRRAEERLLTCDILVILLDRARPLGDEESQGTLRLAASVERRGATCVVVLNKADIPTGIGNTLAKVDKVIQKFGSIEVSAKTHQGLDNLKNMLVKLALRGSSTGAEGGVTVTNSRHFSALERCGRSITLALETVESGRSGEFVAVDLRAGLDSLGEIVGITTTEDILNSVFSRFCIGK